MSASASHVVLFGLRQVARMVQRAIFAIFATVWRKNGVPKRRGRFVPWWSFNKLFWAGAVDQLKLIDHDRRIEQTAVLCKEETARLLQSRDNLWCIGSEDAVLLHSYLFTGNSFVHWWQRVLVTILSNMKDYCDSAWEFLWIWRNLQSVQNWCVKKKTKKMNLLYWPREYTGSSRTRGHTAMTITLSFDDAKRCCTAESHLHQLHQRRQCTRMRVMEKAKIWPWWRYIFKVLSGFASHCHKPKVSIKIAKVDVPVLTCWLHGGAAFSSDNTVRTVRDNGSNLFSCPSSQHASRCLEKCQCARDCLAWKSWTCKFLELPDVVGTP